MDIEKEFTEEYNKNADGIFRFCYFRVSDRETAKDITQETFTKTWKYITLGGEVETLRPFLYKTARNLIIDFYRKKKTESLDSLMEEGFQPSYPSSGIEDMAEVEFVIKKLSQMDDVSRELINLRFIEGLSPKEIAEILNDNPNNISVRIHRTIKKFRKIIKE